MINLRVSDRFLQSELAAEMYVDERLTGDGTFVTLDKPGSVSGPIRFDLVSSWAVRAIKARRAPQAVRCFTFE